MNFLSKLIMSTAFLYLATVVVWGSSWYIVKLHLGEVAAEVSIFYRFVLAALILQLFCLARKKPMGYGFHAHRMFAQLGLFLFCLNFLFIYHASYNLTTGLVSVVFTLVLVFNMVGGRIFIGDRVTLLMVLGAIAGICGIVLIFLPEIDHLDLNDSNIMSAALALIGTLMASAGMVTSAKIQQQGLPVIRSNAWGMVYGAGFMLIYILFNDIPFGFDFSPGYIGSLVFLAVFASVLGFGSFLTLVGRIGAGRASYATVMFPVLALGISTMLEGFQWSLPALAGLAMTLGGNIIILYSRQKTA